VLASPSTVVSALGAALGVTSSSRSSLIGALRTVVGPTTLIYTLAVNRTVAPAGMALTSVTLAPLNVPAPVPYMAQNFSLPAGCTWASPAVKYYQQQAAAAALAAAPPSPVQPPPAIDAAVIAAGASIAHTVVALAGLAATNASGTAAAVNGAPVGHWFMMPGTGLAVGSSSSLQQPPALLWHNATADQVSAAFRAATGVTPSSVSATFAVRDGPYLVNR
jgi:hypothetical protein